MYIMLTALVLFTAKANTNKVWVYNPRNETVVDGVCTAYELFRSEVSSLNPVNEQCNVQLPFICIKSARIVGKELIIIYVTAF